MPYALCLGPDIDNKDNNLADPFKERYPTKFLQDVSEAGEPLQKYPVELIMRSKLKCKIQSYKPAFALHKTRFSTRT